MLPAAPTRLAVGLFRATRRLWILFAVFFDRNAFHAGKALGGQGLAALPWPRAAIRVWILSAVFFDRNTCRAGKALGVQGPAAHLLGPPVGPRATICLWFLLAVT